MKIAVINFSGNVGKSTVSRHLLLPRIEGAQLVTIESVNAGDGQGQALRGRQFGQLQDYLQTVDSAVVDIGASNVEELLGLMRMYSGSHDDFDCFVVPTVPTLKQQQDTIATLFELSQLGVPPARIKLVFNLVPAGTDLRREFETVLDYLAAAPVAHADHRCQLGVNEIYERVRGCNVDLASIAADTTDYKALIAQAKEMARKLELAGELAKRRLASGVLPELDACFAALALCTPALSNAGA